MRVVRIEREDGFRIEIECYDKNGNLVKPVLTQKEKKGGVITCPFCLPVYNKPLPSCPLCNGTKFVQLLKKEIVYGEFGDREKDIRMKVMKVKTPQVEREIVIG